MSYRILGAPISPFVRKTRVFCAEKGIPYQLEPVNPFAPPEGFTTISPLKRIPVLVIEEDGERHHLPDSSVICSYLEQRHDDPPLFPTSPLPRARALWYEEYADSDLTATIGRGVFQPVVLARLLGREPDRAQAEQTIAEVLPRFCDYLETEIGDREFLVGDAFTIADIATTSPFVNLRLSGFDVDAGRWPRLADYLQRMQNRPSFRDCLESEQQLLASL